MKIKGISLFEQHVEKFVLGGFAVVLVGATAMQFLTSPNRVTMDNQQVDPGDIEARLKQKADSVKARLGELAAPTRLLDGDPPEVASEFEKSLAAGVSPRPSLPPTEPSLASLILPSDVALGDVRFYEPKLPAPAMLGVRQETDTLAETTLEQHPELAERLKAASGGGGSGLDIQWAIPTAELDLAELRAELRRADSAAKPPILAIPTLWYNDALWVVDVVFERQERQADGGWTSPTTVALLPGQFSFRKEIPTADAGLRDAVFSYLAQRDKVLEILQPDFLTTKGNVFSPSTILGDVESAASSGEDPAVRRMRQQFDRLRQDQARMKKQLEEAGGPLEPEKPEKPESPRGRDRNREGDGGGAGGGGGKSGPPGGGGGLSGGGGFGKNNTGAGGGKNDEASKKKRISLTQRLKGLESELVDLEEQLKKLAPATDLNAAANAKLLDVAKDDRATVWAHDIDVKPGTVYRYRTHVQAYNPFFTRKRQLVADQQRLADAFVLRTADSEWSQPVSIEPPVTFFVADAVAGQGRLGLGYAKVELYRFHDGERKLETAIVQPGDRVGGVAERARGGTSAVDFGTDWYVVDIVEDTSGERGDQRGAQLVVRRVSDAALLVRSPRVDLSDETRVRFNDEAEAARQAAATREKDKDASPEGGGSPPKGSGPSAPGPGPGLGGPAGGNRPG